MNKTFLSFIAVIFYVTASAQVTTGDTTKPNTLLFPTFKPGYVLMKSGDISKADLNYDGYDHQIVYAQGGQQLTLTNLEDVDTIYFGGRKYVPVKKEVYEIVELGDPVSLLVVYDAKIRPMSTSIGHDGTSRKSSGEVMNNISSTNLQRSRYQNGYEVELVRTFWLQRYHDVFKTNNEKQVVKAFPDYLTSAVKQYFETNKVDLKDPDQLLALVKKVNGSSAPPKK